MSLDTNTEFNIPFRAIKSISESVIITDIHNNIIYANEAFEKMYGYTKSEISGLNAEILSAGINTEEFLHEIRDKTFKGGWNGELLNLRKDGCSILISLSSSVIHDEKGNIIALLGIAREVSVQNAEELAELNLKLQESERLLKETNERKDKFFSILSHDLRSPFNGLFGLTSLLAEEIEDLTRDEIIMFANNINESARVLLDLINDIFNWSRIQTGKIEYIPSEVDINYVIREVFLLLKNNAAKKEITLNNNVSEDTYAFADPHMIHSVTQNLVSNSIKFTNNKGEININCFNSDKFVEISVTDNGVGIDENRLAKLFRIDTNLTTFGTANEKGTGLGLILCKELVEKNHGTIWIESEENKGTKVTFSLPKNQDISNNLSELKDMGVINQRF